VSTGRVLQETDHLTRLRGRRRAGVQVEAGTDALYGYSPVAAALHTGRRSVQTLYVQDGGALRILTLSTNVITFELLHSAPSVEVPESGAVLHFAQCEVAWLAKPRTLCANCRLDGRWLHLCLSSAPIWC